MDALQELKNEQGRECELAVLRCITWCNTQRHCMPAASVYYNVCYTVLQCVLQCVLHCVAPSYAVGVLQSNGCYAVLHVCHHYGVAVAATKLQVTELQDELNTITTDFGETVSNLKTTREVKADIAR